MNASVLQINNCLRHIISHFSIFQYLASNDSVSLDSHHHSDNISKIRKMWKFWSSSWNICSLFSPRNAKDSPPAPHFKKIQDTTRLPLQRPNSTPYIEKAPSSLCFIDNGPDLTHFRHCRFSIPIFGHRLDSFFWDHCTISSSLLAITIVSFAYHKLQYTLCPLCSLRIC